MQLSAVDISPLYSVNYISAEVIDIFNVIAATIFPKLPIVEGSLSFVSQVELNPRLVGSIGHEDLLKFNSAYFLRNCLKCLIALDETKAFKINNLLDIGCGTGTATIAWSIMRQKFRLQKSLAECIDRSPVQLNQAKNLLEASGLEEIVTSYCDSRSAGTKKFGRLSILSYCLCEMFWDGISNDNKICNLSRDNLIIDYHGFLLKFLNENPFIFSQYTLKTSIYMLPLSIATLLNKKALKVSYLYAKTAG